MGSKILTIISGKGGVGKTTTAINLGVALNSFGKEVIIVDANLTTPNVGLHLGAPMVPVTLNHVLIGKAKVADALYEHSSGTKIMPSSLSVKELGRLNHKKLKDVGRSLKKMADYVIYDAAAGLGEEAVASIESSDHLIIVTNPEITAVTDALKTIKLAEEMGKDVKGVIVTRVKRSRSQMPIANIKEMLGVPLIGVVPEDDAVPMALTMKDAVFHVSPNSKSAMAYKKIAADIAGIRYKTPSFMARFFGKS